MDSYDNSITIMKGDPNTYKLKVNKDLIGVGKDYVIFELSAEAMMQLGKLALDIVSSDDVKELTLKL